ncbi:MAG TPA: HlyD family efflux transporter periplasmic adaptor subunit [Bryobacteraceae bacterium]|nr:HlyD family efflux transporter periplasmic adaptor subunit [Bryobacteraceae bacterium]
MGARIWLVLGLIALGAVLTTGRSQSPDKKSNKTVLRVLRLSGQTSARRYASIAAPMPAGLENRSLELTYLVKAGEPVKKGQLLAQLDGQSSATQVEDLAAQVKQAKSDIQRRQAEQAVAWETLQQSLRQAKAEAEKAKAEAERAKMDAARQPGASTGVERELLRLNVEETEARYSKLQETAKFQKASFDAEMRILDLSRELEQRHHDRYAHDLRQIEMKAPMDGLTVMQSIVRGGEAGPVQLGDQIAPGQLFMKVVDVQSMQLEARANQTESSLLHVGQRVNVRLDAFPALSLPGHIYSIGALAVGSGGQSYYIRNIVVNIAIDGSDPKLIPNLAASGDVVLE